MSIQIQTNNIFLCIDGINSKCTISTDFLNSLNRRCTTIFIRLLAKVQQKLSENTNSSNSKSNLIRIRKNTPNAIDSNIQSCKSGKDHSNKLVPEVIRL